MQIPINKTVTWTEPVPTNKSGEVAKVEVQQFTILNIGGKLLVSSAYRWLAADGTELRRGLNTLKEEDLAQGLGEAFAPIKAALLGLMDSSMKNPSLVLKVSDAQELSLVIVKKGATAQRLDEAALTAAGLNPQVLKAAIVGLCTSIVS